MITMKDLTVGELIKELQKMPTDLVVYDTVRQGVTGVMSIDDKYVEILFGDEILRKFGENYE